MARVSPIFAEALNWGGLTSQPNWQAILLMGGSAVLAVVLLILVLTRWGQAKILSKCIALSVFAHLLLLAYAYGIKLFQDVPESSGEAIIQLSIAAATEPETEPLPKEHQPELWEDLPDEAIIAPSPVPFDRPEPRDADPQHRLVDTPDIPPDVPIPPEPPANDPQLPSIVMPPPLVATAPAPAPLDVPDSQPPAPLAVADTMADPPSPLQPRRLQMEDDQARPLIQETETEQARLSDEELQRLMQLPWDNETAEASPGPEDRLDATHPPDAPQVQPAPVAMENVSRQPDDRQWHSAADASRTGPSSGPGETPARQFITDYSVPAVYRSRFATDRRALLARFGGSDQTETAVQQALAWLAANQSADGRWDGDQHASGQETRVLGHDRGGAGADADTGITALTLLAFMGAGQTHLSGEYQSQVQSGLDFLLRSQAPDGNLTGAARLFARMYCHGMATLALSEAYALTGDSRYRPAVERAIRYTLRAQHPVDGGWRYRPGDTGDTSQFGWQLMALRSAQLAGLPIPDAARSRMVYFLRRVATGEHRGLASYQPGGPPTMTMTAEALSCHFFLNARPEDAAIAEATRFLLRQTPRGGPINLYYWYYGTVALFQLQGDAWETWNYDLKERLLAARVADGSLSGSWPANTVWGRYGGRIYTTAMATLCLEVYYRHLPLYGDQLSERPRTATPSPATARPLRR